MSLFTAQLYPNRGLGFLLLGASLHDVLTRLKAEPQRFPSLEIVYSHDKPVAEPVCILLPDNGIRLRFDGKEQRLRLIEVVDFTKNHITFKERDLVRPANSTSAPGSPVPGESSAGPSFKHIYHRLLGPTYAGEFIHPQGGQGGEGTYVLSYPGVAFNFPLESSAYSPDKDVVSLLSTPSNLVASSMAVFCGESWAEARGTLWTSILQSVKLSSAAPRGKDVYPDEISLVRIHGGGRLQLFRRWSNNSFWIKLGTTTPQELVMELGPPNATYRKNDQKMIIHKMRTTSNARDRPNAAELGRAEDMTDTDHSSMNTGSDDSDDDEAVENQANGNSASGEYFYNYFYLGFDVLMSRPVTPSSAPPPRGRDSSSPSENGGAGGEVKACSPEQLVATKIILHGNIPGSYEFNRHRRCRWEIAYLADAAEGGSGAEGAEGANSESEFARIEERLNERWDSGAQARGGPQQPRQRGMVLNRGWGDSPGSSCEFLGGWEDNGARRADVGGGSTMPTMLYGFPGLVFEVLKNGFVNTVTVF